MANRSYEALYIVRPELKDTEVQKIADRYKKVVEDHGGEVAKAEKWEKRKLAYELNGLKEGNYIIMNFSAPGDVPAELSRLLRISDDVIRHTIVKEEA
ncbi:MAG: 30S ribosomal protein S6 [Armatimonadetes bacterium]|nr:30S ribosomal protein S6 [Armatimonadota bacterium]MBS1702781.1 30S ribosomal protein S6 [Armatimonadota bacterium]MBS1727167.1 30S ribosomal protein S6 [Armatimonadota bacterium]